MGYVGYSMSERARSAYENGERPRSRWNRKEVVRVVLEEDGYDIGLGDVDYEDDSEVEICVKAIRIPKMDDILEYSAWHHTSKFFNCTDFYRLTDEGFDMVRAELDEHSGEILEEVRAMRSERWAQHKRWIEETIEEYLKEASEIESILSLPPHHISAKGNEVFIFRGQAKIREMLERERRADLSLAEAKKRDLRMLG